MAPMTRICESRTIAMPAMRVASDMNDRNVQFSSLSS